MKSSGASIMLYIMRYLTRHPYKGGRKRQCRNAISRPSQPACFRLPLPSDQWGLEHRAGRRGAGMEGGFAACLLLPRWLGLALRPGRRHPSPADQTQARPAAERPQRGKRASPAALHGISPLGGHTDPRNQTVPGTSRRTS